MPTLSKQGATIFDDFGVAEDRHDDVDGYTVNFVTIREDHDFAPMLSALPGGQCQGPHWGVVFKGRLTVTYTDHTETISAGEAFYMPPATPRLPWRGWSSSSSARPKSWPQPRTR